MSESIQGLKPGQARVKRVFDFSLGLLGLILVGWLIWLLALLARLDTGQSGFFRQERIGYEGKPFQVIKIRTMRPVEGVTTTVTHAKDSRITGIGGFLRRTKLDELPQLISIVRGEMSFVGPRPDVPGFADRLQGHDRLLLTVRPGMTGPATLKYRHEEALLAEQVDPDLFNREVLFPEKVKVNVAYVENWSFKKDLLYIWKTVTGSSEV